MTDHVEDAGRIERVLGECLERPEAEWSSAVLEACRAHPVLAQELRRRFDSLRAFGMVDVENGEPPEARYFGPFELIRPLGSGGTASVYLARRGDEGPEIAIKILRADLLQSEVARQRFQREVDLASRLEHPGICKVLGTGSVDGVPYIAMPHVAGDSLAEQVEAAQAPPTSRQQLEHCVSLIEQVARTLAAAHTAGLVHRDIKPANIIVTPAEQPVLMDLGLAADSDDGQSLTMPGTLLGTPIYMAPEVITGQSADQCSDIYSLGVTLFECLTLQTPWRAPTREALFQNVLHGAEPDPRSCNPAIDQDLALIVSTAMARPTHRRYESASAFAEDLARWRAGQRLTVRRPGPALRFGRWVSRNRAVAGVLLLLGTALTATAVSLLETRRAFSEVSALALSAAAAQARLGEPELAVLLAREAVQRSEDPATVSELHAALADLHTWTGHPADQADLGARFPIGFGTPPDTKGVVGFTGEPLDRTSDGGHLLTVDPTEPHRVQLWRIRVGNALPIARLEGHDERVLSAWFAADGQRIVTGSEDQTARIWDLQGNELNRLPRHGCIVHAARFSPDGRMVLTGGGDGVARLFDAEGDLLSEFRGHGGLIRAVAISADGLQVATASEDGTARIWSRPTHGLPGTLDRDEALVAGTIARDGRIVAVDREGRLRFHDPAGATIATPAQFDGAQAVLTTAGDAILTRTDTSAALWDLDGEPLGGLAPHRDSVRYAALDAARRVLVTSDGSATLTWWNRSDSVWTPQRSLDLSLPIRAVDITRDGALVAAGNEDGAVAFIDGSGEPREFQAHDRLLWTVRFGPDGARLLTASRDNTARVFDLEGNELMLLTGHGGTVLCATFAPDGQRIATASVDQTIRLWSPSGQPLAVLRGHMGQVRHLAFSADGRRLLSCSADRTARTWLPQTQDLLELAADAVPREFTEAEQRRYAELLGW